MCVRARLCACVKEMSDSSTYFKVCIQLDWGCVEKWESSWCQRLSRVPVWSRTKQQHCSTFETWTALLSVRPRTLTEVCFSSPCSITSLWLEKTNGQRQPLNQVAQIWTLCQQKDTVLKCLIPRWLLGNRPLAHSDLWIWRREQQTNLRVLEQEQWLNSTVKWDLNKNPNYE